MADAIPDIYRGKEKKCATATAKKATVLKFASLTAAITGTTAVVVAAARKKSDDRRIITVPGA